MASAFTRNGTTEDCTLLLALQIRFNSAQSLFSEMIMDAKKCNYYVNKEKYSDIKYGMKKIKLMLSKLDNDGKHNLIKVKKIEDYFNRIDNWLKKLIVSDKNEIASIKNKLRKNRASHLFTSTSQITNEVITSKSSEASLYNFYK